MARALIVGCGCRALTLGAELRARGWQVRGTTRDSGRLATIEAAGIEAALADPDRIGTVVEQLEGVALIYWLLGFAAGPPAVVEPLHTDRLERLLEEIVDTPVRGLVYELGDVVGVSASTRAIEILRDAGERWRIPYEIVDAARDDDQNWRAGMVAAGEALLGVGSE